MEQREGHGGQVTDGAGPRGREGYREQGESWVATVVSEGSRYRRHSFYKYSTVKFTSGGGDRWRTVARRAACCT